MCISVKELLLFSFTHTLTQTCINSFTFNQGWDKQKWPWLFGLDWPTTYSHTHTSYILLFCLHNEWEHSGKKLWAMNSVDHSKISFLKDIQNMFIKALNGITAHSLQSLSQRVDQWSSFNDGKAHSDFLNTTLEVGNIWSHCIGDSF